MKHQTKNNRHETPDKKQNTALRHEHWTNDDILYVNLHLTKDSGFKLSHSQKMYISWETIFWHMTGYNIWVNMTFDWIWHMTGLHSDKWHCCNLITWYDELHRMTIFYRQLKWLNNVLVDTWPKIHTRQLFTMHHPNLDASQSTTHTRRYIRYA